MFLRGTMVQQPWKQDANLYTGVRALLYYWKKALPRSAQQERIMALIDLDISSAPSPSQAEERRKQPQEAGWQYIPVYMSGQL